MFVSTERETQTPDTRGTAAPLIAPVAVGVGVGTAVIALLIAAGVGLVVVFFLCFL